MKKNRKRVKHARVLPPLPVTGLVVLIVTLALFYWTVDSKSAQLGQELRKYEQEFAAVEDERLREEAWWHESNTPEKLVPAMLSHGIVMTHPEPQSTVFMDANGRPIENQLSMRTFRKDWSGPAVGIENKAPAPKK